MAETADMENPKATYEKLAELEKDFEDTELEIGELPSLWHPQCIGKVLATD